MNPLRTFLKTLLFYLPFLFMGSGNSALAFEYKLYGKMVCEVKDIEENSIFKSIDIGNYKNEQNASFPTDLGVAELLLSHSPSKEGGPGKAFSKISVSDTSYKFFIPVSHIQKMKLGEVGERRFEFKSGISLFNVSCQFWRISNGE